MKAYSVLLDLSNRTSEGERYASSIRYFRTLPFLRTGLELEIRRAHSALSLFFWFPLLAGFFLVVFLFVFARIYPRLLTVTTGAKTGHGVEDWVLRPTLACHSFPFLVTVRLTLINPSNSLRNLFLLKIDGPSSCGKPVKAC